jgi:hypothetical protein
MALLHPFSQNTAVLLEVPPVAGETHLWLARAAAGLANSRVVSREDCAVFLRDVMRGWCKHRAVPEREIQAAVRLAYEEPKEVSAARYVWPAMDPEQRAAGLTCPPRFDVLQDTGLTTAEALQGLYGPEELICAGRSCFQPEIRSLAEWLSQKVDECQFIVANPMRGLLGTTKEGRQSPRCQDNVAMRRYVIAEFDEVGFSKENQARLASALSIGLPLRLVVDSGGKSLHCWYDCRGWAEEQIAEFFEAAVLYGADQTRWDSCGWVRMPGGWRRAEGAAAVRQKVVFADFLTGGAVWVK